MGGLGLRETKSINQASMMKAGWHLLTRKEDLWVKVVKAKYKCGNDLIPKLIRDKPGSNLWRGLCRAWDNVKENIVWRVGDGRAINCLKDLWIPNIGKLEIFSVGNPTLLKLLCGFLTLVIKKDGYLTNYILSSLKTLSSMLLVVCLLLPRKGWIVSLGSWGRMEIFPTAQPMSSSLRSSLW